MRLILCAVVGSMMAIPAVAQEQSTWWHGSFVNAGSTQACESNDSLTTFSATSVQPWETFCEITLQTDIRDTQGVLLDIACGFPDSPDEGFVDRRVLLELSSGNMLSYSRLSKESIELRRCPRMSLAKATGG